MAELATHQWIRADRPEERRAALVAEPCGTVLAVLDAHRRLRGPYTAAGALLRLIVPEALTRCPELVHRHDIEILSVAPELRSVVPATRETLTSLAVPAERTRFYSRLRTARLANGLTEFLHGYLRQLGGGPRCLLVDNLHHADPTDRELFAVLLRRADPAVLCLHLATAADLPADPPGPVPFRLGDALARYAAVRTAPAAAVRTAPAAARTAPAAVPQPRAGDDDDEELARRYVWSDGVTDGAGMLAAYQRLDPARRAALHDARGDELVQVAEASLRIGAIPYHREHGSEPAVAGVASLYEALFICLDNGFYHATVELGRRGLALVDPVTQPIPWWAFTTKMTTSLSALGRGEEAIELYDEARARTTDPTQQRQAAYATAMLYTRHLSADRHNQRLARAWSNIAIALTEAIADPRERAFQSAFQRNGLALVATHDGSPDEALRLVEDGIDRLDRELDDGQHALHRSVLRHNRSMLHLGAGRYEAALADLDAVIEADPNYAEYRFDRGNLLRRMGRPLEALADYETALTLSPPFPEVYYNRGDTRLELGDADGAAADFGYVLELDPDYVDAYLNRAGLRLAAGDLTGAAEDTAAGLRIAPGNAHLLCVRGQLELSDGDPAAAERTLSAALAAAPELAAGWAARATARYELGDVPAALADLDRALSLRDDPEMRFNRAVLLAEAGRHAEAVDDLTAAGESSDDVQIRWERARSLLALGDTIAADDDLRACAAADPELADQARHLRPQLLQR
ncbi:tetratricopeptide repeat protein [Actinoplanes sp. KI2]|uniref:tetratricopeptide repeat protein n=1 Tax=Actinoplanes sp. KI2 TaxID=2983315 RepID=UPI0021D576F8|nr:tetratricopeptide repeat protein [Actinoplanes sp. KI2]MCU7723849.1 tetratricopeptide repeat protein [Actinoplanes sp. KI2]